MMNSTPPKTYHDPRFLKARSAHDKAWQNPTPIVNSVLGQNHTTAMKIDLDLSGSVSDTMSKKIELSAADYYERCDRKLLSIFGCFCKVAEAIQSGRVVNTEHNGVWRLMVDGECVESLKAHEVLNTFCY